MYQFVIPIHHVNWSTRSVLEGISQKYKPKQIYVVTSNHEIKIFKDKSNSWDIENLTLLEEDNFCLLYTSPSPRDATLSRMPSSA